MKISNKKMFDSFFARYLQCIVWIFREMSHMQNDSTKDTRYHELLQSAVENMFEVQQRHGIKKQIKLHSELTHIFNKLSSMHDANDEHMKHYNSIFHRLEFLSMWNDAFVKHHCTCNVA